MVEIHSNLTTGVRPLSYTEITLWNEDKEKYADLYIRDIISKPNLPIIDPRPKVWRNYRSAKQKAYLERKALRMKLFRNKRQVGMIVHRAIFSQEFDWEAEIKALNLDPNVIVKINQLLLEERKQHVPEYDITINTATIEDIPITAVYDGLDLKSNSFYEYKVTVARNRWSQYKVDHNFQLSFYAYVFSCYKSNIIPNVFLHQLNAYFGQTEVFRSTRGADDLLQVHDVIVGVYKEMVEKRIWEKRRLGIIHTDQMDTDPDVE